MLTSIYELLCFRSKRQTLFLVFRSLWLVLLFSWLMVETHATVSVFDSNTRLVFWLGFLAWSAVSLSVVLLLFFKDVGLSEKWLTLGLSTLVVWDGLFLGLVVGMTGVGYSLALLPSILFLLTLSFVGTTVQFCAGCLSVVLCSFLGGWFSVLDGGSGSSWFWAGGGAVVIVGVGLTMSWSINRYGRSSIGRFLERRWGESVRLAAFDFAPLGLVVCDGQGRFVHVNPFLLPFVQDRSGALSGTIFGLSKSWSRFSRMDEFLSVYDKPVVLNKGSEGEEGIFHVFYRPIALPGPNKDAFHLFVFVDMTHTARRFETETIHRKWQSFENVCAKLVQEIQTPLNALLGVVETLVDQKTPFDERKRVFSIVQTEAQRLDGMVENLLVSFGTNIVLQKQPQDIASVCDSFFAKMSKDQRVSESNIPLFFHNQLPETLVLKLDRQRLEEALGNLFDNAVDAVLDGGDRSKGISLELNKTNNGGVGIALVDGGCGIPEEVLPFVYDPFFTTKKHPGAGLGLSVAFKVVNAHGGTLRLQNLSRASGTKAEIVFQAPSVEKQDS